MKTFAAGAVLVLVLILANVVAAGVLAVLGPLALELEGEAARVSAVVLVGLLAVACALAFLRGALRVALDCFGAGGQTRIRVRLSPGGAVPARRREAG